MKKILFISLTVLLLASCTPQKPLYSWGKYEATSYNYLKNSDEKSTQELIETYQKIIEKQKGTRGVVPPGVYADYGFVLLQANKTEEGKTLLLKEVALYPESKIFIDRILKMIEE
ncbi:DUF4810 domain-containing protein [Draconibacterium orientale]|uniref:DUF4810 domain-containing protein n=1 Tax=Draconibacterium orientale TaxID=1168034 RepID=UPI0029BFD281|nr:DUF4810 domain-containing protein [Draconibacterium orientale]MBN2635911.1 DUF4810 domain-containing protein [Prolixibacteraceae bacterium]